jgi:hypothetical protein
MQETWIKTKYSSWLIYWSCMEVGSSSESSSSRLTVSCRVSVANPDATMSAEKLKLPVLTMLVQTAFTSLDGSTPHRMAAAEDPNKELTI